MSISLNISVFFNHANFHHLVDINPYMTDEQVWNYALEKGYTILTDELVKQAKNATLIVAEQDKLNILF